MTADRSPLPPGGRALYWFRNDLRLGDNPALELACATSSALLPVYVHDPAQDADTRWGFVRRGPHRHRFVHDSLSDLSTRLEARGSRLLQLEQAHQGSLASQVQAQSRLLQHALLQSSASTARLSRAARRNRSRR